LIFGNKPAQGFDDKKLKIWQNLGKMNVIYLFVVKIVEHFAASLNDRGRYEAGEEQSWAS
jgi:peptidoglycan biosynthesis protein MviN/MurJ (putative lipid II flippase)